jgi:peroxiredoxin
MIKLLSTLIFVCSLKTICFADGLFLAQSPQETKPLVVGTQVPEVSLTDLNGKDISLTQIILNKPTILVFYRGSWCPYCNRQLSALGEIESKLLNLGFQILAVSPDKQDGLKKMIEKNHLNYRLFSDSKMNVSSAFGLSFRVSDKVIKAYRGYGVELPQIPESDGRWLPVPAVFVIGKSGKISFVFSNPDYKVRLSNDELLKIADLSVN